MRVRVERVIDGDSVLVARDRGLAGMLFGGGTVEVRLFGIDAPELGQSFGFEARSALEGMSRGPLTLKTRSKDRYGRTVGTLMDSRGRSVNLMMVEAGFAHAFTRFGTIRGVREAERRARAARRGVWVARVPETPWDYRRAVAARRQRARRARRVVWAVLLALFALAALALFALSGPFSGALPLFDMWDLLTSAYSP